jgi:translation initiation factor RLI1
MPGKMALVVFDKCQPEKCQQGDCLAVEACPHHLIKQEGPNSKPMFHPSTCQGCGDCARVCPLKAVQIIRM